MAIIVAKALVILMRRINLKESFAPNNARRPKRELGKMVKELAFSKTKVVMERVEVSGTKLVFCNSSMAFNPKGVEAVPKPKRLHTTFPQSIPTLYSLWAIPEIIDPRFN